MRVLITGVAGQDGLLLSDALLREKHSVIGVVKPGTSTEFLRRYVPAVEIAECDLADESGIRSVVEMARPDTVFNFGGFSSVGESWQHAEEVAAVNTQAVTTMLDALMRTNPDSRFLLPSSGAIFEGTTVTPQSENTPVAPLSPYAKSKAQAMEAVTTARHQGYFASSAVLYNHESPLRGKNFVTRRITEAVARIATGQQEVLELGNLDVRRDWGWAPDYVAGMRAMLNADTPGDYVLGTGKQHRLTEFIALAFSVVGIEDWSERVISRTDLRRTTDTSVLCGDSTKAYAELDWKHTYTFDQIVHAMVHADIAELQDPDIMWRAS